MNDFESSPLEDLTFPVISTDGKQWAFFGIENGNIHFTNRDESEIIYDEILTATDFGDIVYSPNGMFLAYSYFQGSNEIINLPFRKLTVSNRWGKFFIDNSGRSFAMVGQIGDKYVLNINGKHGISYDSILPVGFWSTGEFIYAAYNGSWEIYRNDKVLGSNYLGVPDILLNKDGSVLVALVRLASSRYMSILFSDIYYDPVYGKTYDYAWGLALHPSEPIYGYGASNHSREYVVQNSVEYGATPEIGTPFYSHNGDELIFIGRGEFEPFISVNGKLIYVKVALYTDDIIAKKPDSPTLAFKTNVALAVYYFETEALYTSNMYDYLSNPIYNHRADAYEALATIYNRLYLVQCKING